MLCENEKTSKKEIRDSPQGNKSVSEFVLRVSMRTMSSFTIGTGGNFVDIMFSELGLTPSSIKGGMRTALSWAIRRGMVRGSSCDEIYPSMITRRHQGRPCDVCSLFGYPDHEGRVMVTADGNRTLWDKPYVQVVTHVSIDDDSGTAKRGALFRQETASPEEEFHFAVRVQGDEEDLCLTLASLHFMRFLRLGKGGMIDLKVTGVEKVINGKPSTVKAPLQVDWVWSK